MTPPAHPPRGWTAGPWITTRVHEGEGYVLTIRYQSGGTQPTIAAVWDDNSMAIGEGIANARLIAAAPDLYDALERIGQWIEAVDRTPITAALNIADAWRLYAEPALRAARANPHPAAGEEVTDA